VGNTITTKGLERLERKGWRVTQRIRDRGRTRIQVVSKRHRPRTYTLVQEDT